ncbi:hypothetical protein PUNSTDRAFT_141568 [Punctularia strigosozonata HHB-11173 SS5]|uniref:uncharacterized protein n=1 Tax=Punctularia strigosozonata (strain HHB-11173) TaxID=741275 RepID=UPI0004417882|nr:uncharacterized protein PUNSTDRAFT_141568 [Punctularia strigosozonata HHB-11173 SS5]EIN13048.1 hypothetical protein PUNSTDRAFT_141568 [Punctularia strigosozonata HHB-11173 SS5]
MPPGTPYNSFVLPYSIRVDAFASNATIETVPALHLLTHTHSDHITGLSAKSFAATIICSPDAKEMLLRYEVYAERNLYETEMRAEKIRAFAHLKVEPRKHLDGTTFHHGSRDLLRAIPLHTPTAIELYNSESVVITLIDANHCPGAVMFLVEGSKGAVLHTGDFRAEPYFLEGLKRNPFLLRYIVPQSITTPDGHGGVRKTLDAVYLDTACLFSNLNVPPKDVATFGLVELVQLFPPETLFFLNTWTWGYEDILKGIAHAFDSKIHVDRYKHSVFSHISDPFMRAIITRDAKSTRFHACERFAQCSPIDDMFAQEARENNGRIVYINPVTMGSESWNTYRQTVKKQLRNGKVVNILLVPLSRHSPLPELKQFVSMFRPRQVVPNTLVPALHGLDWAYANHAFAPCLSPTARLPSDEDVVDFPWFERNGFDIKVDSSEGVDAALKNLEGADADDHAAVWAEQSGVRKRLEQMRHTLDGRAKVVVEEVLGRMPELDVEETVVAGEDGGEKKAGRGMAIAADSDEETEDDDERGRTAHKLFAALAGVDSDDPIRSPQPSSQVSKAAADSPPSPAMDVDDHPHEMQEQCFKGIVSETASNLRHDGSRRLPPTPLTSPLGDPGPSTLRHCRFNDDKTPKTIPACRSPMRSALPTRTPQRVALLKDGTERRTSVPRRIRHETPFVDLNNIPSQPHTPAKRAFSSGSPSPTCKRRRPWDTRFDSTPRASDLQPGRLLSVSPEIPMIRLRPSSDEQKSGCADAPSISLPATSLPSSEGNRARRERRRATAERRKSLTENLRRAAGNNPLQPLRRRLSPQQHPPCYSGSMNEGGPRDKVLFGTAGLAASSSTVEYRGDQAMDWDRGRELRDSVRAQVSVGLRPILPTLSCLDSPHLVTSARPRIARRM